MKLHRLLRVFGDVTFPVVAGAALGGGGLVLAASGAGSVGLIRGVLWARRHSAGLAVAGFHGVASGVAGLLLAATGAALGPIAVFGWTAAALRGAARKRRRRRRTKSRAATPARRAA